MSQFQTALPTLLTQQLESHASVQTIKLCAPDETRLGLLPVVRRRIPACGGQPVAPVTYHFDNFSLYGAGEPTTGASVFLELPYLNSRAFQGWLDGFAAALPASLNILVLDNGAGPKAQAVHGPSNGLPVFLPPYSPERNPRERLWRDLKDKLADVPVNTLEEWSEAMGAMIQNYSQATLQSLTSFPYVVHAVAYVQKAIYV
jgi:putative transposase